MPNKHRHAIVIGASMSGLLAARALETVFERVTILERDVLSGAAAPRKSVPQGAHAHGLLSRGRDVIESLFPGISKELAARGAIEVDYLDDMIWVSDGRAICSGPSSIRGLLVSRPCFEEQIRARVLKSARVEVLDKTALSDLVTTPDGDRIVGVKCEHEGRMTTIRADLVVDASGRGSRTPEWLKALGYQPPRDEKVLVGVTYTTCTFRRGRDDFGGKKGAVVAASEPNWRCGALLAQEGDRWIASIGGYFGDRAPNNIEGFLAFAKTLPVPHIYNVLKNAEPLTPFVTYSFVGSLRRHYEELTSFPDGYVVIGDAVCSFNPIYGQGMTVAALEAQALCESLRGGADAFAMRFFKNAKSLIDVPWDIVVGNDLRHPKTVGQRSSRLQMVNWYLGKLKKRLPSDVALSTSFLSVSNMKAPPSSLLTPRMLWRVFAPRRQVIERQEISSVYVGQDVREFS